MCCPTMKHQRSETASLNPLALVSTEECRLLVGIGGSAAFVRAIAFLNYSSQAGCGGTLTPIFPAR